MRNFSTEKRQIYIPKVFPPYLQILLSTFEKLVFRSDDKSIKESALITAVSSD